MLFPITCFWANCLANSSLDNIFLSYCHHTWILHKLIRDLTDFRLNALLWILCIHSECKFRYALPLKVSPLYFFPPLFSGNSVRTDAVLQWVSSEKKIKTDCNECWSHTGLQIKFLFLPHFHKLVRCVIFGIKFSHAWSVPRSTLLWKTWEIPFSDPV